MDEISSENEINEGEEDNENITNAPMIVKSPIINVSQKIAKNASENSEKGKNNKEPAIKREELNKDSKTPSKIYGDLSQLRKDSPEFSLKIKFNQGTLQSINEQLKGIIFSGWIGEREYVEKIKEYRDIIEVDEWETSINIKLRAIVNCVAGIKEGTKWINITAPSAISTCYRLWVLLETPPFPGHYWFQIQDITYESRFGLKINLKIIRSIDPFDGESLREREKRLRGGEDLSADEWKEWMNSVTNFNLQEIASTTMAVLTPSNISKFFRLSIVLSVTLVVASVAFLKQFWIFTLRFIRELGIFMHNATPFLESLLRFIEKIYGGFCLLIAMIYRDFTRPSQAPPDPRPNLGIEAPRPIRNASHSPTYVSPNSWRYRKEQ